MSDTSIMQKNGLSAFYGQSQALFFLSLNFPATGAVAILGRNGAGKTTLMQTIAGEHPAKGGEIVLDGRRIETEPTQKRARAGIGYVPQDRVVFPKLTVKENLLIGAMQTGKASYDEALEVFPKLAARLAQAAGTLSGGERKMLGIARAILGQPRILLLDEPTEGVWIGVIEEIADTLANLARRISVVIVEQNLDMALRIANHVYLLDRGTVALSGSADAVRNGDDLKRLLAP